MSLLQRRYSLGRTAAVNQIPILDKLIPMKIEPLQHETQRPLREISMHDPALDISGISMWLSGIST
jgi:hypothetical protein